MYNIQLISLSLLIEISYYKLVPSKVYLILIIIHLHLKMFKHSEIAITIIFMDFIFYI